MPNKDPNGQKQADQYSPEETQRRLDRALKRSVTMPPKKGSESGRKKKPLIKPKIPAR
jgi:hypothetical protein